ncbi:MAG: glycosyltransferase, partial [Vicinamibacterales bacterium]|nr:glycosyltransferase [Vicinamibacterales bacterium]
RGLPVHLVIAGPDAGARRAVQRRIAGTRLASVTLHGLLTGDAKLAALAAADVFALPARGEGLPMAALEALASGVPVVTAPGNGLDEIGPAGAGRVVARDAGAIAAALVETLNDPSRRAAMSAAARALATARYSCQRVVAQLDEVYRLARSHAHPPPSQP